MKKIKSSSSSQLVLFLTLVLALAAQASQAAELYKWIDENGKVHYSDKVPPSHSKHQRDVLNEQGITVKKVDAPKTAQQLEEEAKQAEILAEQKKVKEKQAAYDRMLLNSYLNLESLIDTRDAQITAIKYILRSSNITLKNQEQRLIELRTSAANHERGGKPVPEVLLTEIENTKIQIQKTHDYMASKQERQEEIRKKYEKDIKRYRKLKGSG